MQSHLQLYSVKSQPMITVDQWLQECKEWMTMDSR